LLCKFKPNQVLQTLKESSYPLDDSLTFTKQYYIRDAAAYLLERSGAIEEALIQLIDLIDDILRVYIKEVIGIPVSQK
jgi:hypothetical protein